MTDQERRCRPPRLSRPLLGDFLSTIRVDDGGLWLLTRRRLRDVATVHVLHGQRGLVYCKAETLAYTLASCFTTSDTWHFAVINAWKMRQKSSFAEPVKLASSREVQQLLRRMSSKKSPGPNALAPHFSRTCSGRFSPCCSACSRPVSFSNTFRRRGRKRRSSRSSSLARTNCFRRTIESPVCSTQWAHPVHFLRTSHTPG